MSKNIYFKLFISFYSKKYDQIKKIVYQISEKPKSKKWCNTIAIYRPYYEEKHLFTSPYKVFSNIFTFIHMKFSKKWDIFESLIEFEDTFNLKINIPGKENNVFNLSNVDEIEAKKTVDTVKIKYGYLSDPYLKYNLFILKKNEYYFTKLIYCSKTQDLLFPKKTFVSNIKFMTIEYVHPSLKTPLLIDLSHFRFAVKSHILDFLFVYWYLRSNYGNWVDCIFDMNYKLNIIDEGFHFFELSSAEFIILEENNYNVQRHVQ